MKSGHCLEHLVQQKQCQFGLKCLTKCSFHVCISFSQTENDDLIIVACIGAVQIHIPIHFNFSLFSQLKSQNILYYIQTSRLVRVNCHPCQFVNLFFFFFVPFPMLFALPDFPIAIVIGPFYVCSMFNI